MTYRAAFAGIKEPELRRMLMGDRKHDPLTAVTFLAPWVWDAVCAIARRDGMGVGGVLARAVRDYVTAEGYNAPTPKRIADTGAVPPTEKPPSRRGVMARLAGHFTR